MAKDTRKKTKGKKRDGAPKAKATKATKAAKRVKSVVMSPMMAEVVAAALVATAAALKDSKKARQLAAQAGNELEKLAKEGSEKGNAMWQLALDIGRRSLDALSGDEDVAKRARRTKK